MTKPVQHIAEQRAFGLEIETVQRVVVKESPIDRCGSFERWRRMAAIERLEIGGERLRRFAARLRSGPGPHPALRKRRAAPGLYRLLTPIAIDILPLLRAVRLPHFRPPSAEGKV